MLCTNKGAKFLNEINAVSSLLNTPDLPDSAELAFAVDEAYQGLGIATLLLSHLTELARASGIKQFTALVLPENQKMLNVFKKCRLEMQQVLNEVGVFEIVLKL